VNLQQAVERLYEDEHLIVHLTDFQTRLVLDSAEYAIQSIKPTTSQERINQKTNEIIQAIKHLNSIVHTWSGIVPEHFMNHCIKIYITLHIGEIHESQKE
jgi:PP-loop superfamily ATP-utilizing enzyme